MLNMTIASAVRSATIISTINIALGALVHRNMMFISILITVSLAVGYLYITDKPFTPARLLTACCLYMGALLVAISTAAVITSGCPWAPDQFSIIWWVSLLVGIVQTAGMFVAVMYFTNSITTEVNAHSITTNRK